MGERDRDYQRERDRDYRRERDRNYRRERDRNYQSAFGRRSSARTDYSVRGRPKRLRPTT